MYILITYFDYIIKTLRYHSKKATRIKRLIGLNKSKTRKRLSTSPFII